MRDGFLIAGALAAASAPAIVQWLFGLSDTPDGHREKFFWSSILYTPLLIGTAWWCVLAIRERTPHTRNGNLHMISGLRQVVRNRPFMVLLLAYTISAIGNNLPATLILFFFQYVLQSELADFFLLLYFAIAIIFLPGWIFISRRSPWNRCRPVDPRYGDTIMSKTSPYLFHGFCVSWVIANRRGTGGRATGRSPLRARKSNPVMRHTRHTGMAT